MTTGKLIAVICAAVLLTAGLVLLRFGLVRRYRGKTGTPDHWSYDLIFFLVKLWRANKQQLVIRDELLAEAAAASMLVSNHEYLFDLYCLYRLRHPKRRSFIGADL